MNRHRSRGRRGYILVFFAMFLFGFMALAALVIDVGFARLAQRQMQTAVDAAALEGLRFRDNVPDWLRYQMLDAGVDPAYAENPDYARRWLASRIVAWTFDDNLDPSDDDLIGFGAGPDVELGPPIEGAEDLNAGQLLKLPDTPFYKPRRSDEVFGLEPNLDNEVYGDMVAGEYYFDKDHDEDEDYTRKDFKSKKDFTTPNDRDNAFLVRMRRTNNFGGLDGVDEVSSHGPPIPYLFGRGALFPAGDPNPAAGYSPRHHGMTVRATAISDGTPALSAGRSRLGDELPGTVPFAIERSAWEDDVQPDTESIIRVTEGTIELLRDAEATTGRPIGIVIHAAGESELRSLGDPITVQEPLIIHDYIRAVVENQPGQRGYVVVIGDTDDEEVAGRVIGFGYVDKIRYYDPTNPDSRFVMTKRTGRIAAENASAVPVRGVDPDIAAKLIQENKKLQDGLLVPVSRPTYGRRRE